MKRWMILILIGIILACYGLARILVMREISFTDVGQVIAIFVVGFLAIVVGLVFLNKRTLELLIEASDERMENNKNVNMNSLIFNKTVYDKGPNIVVIGGGTGLNTVLSGLKNYTNNFLITSVLQDENLIFELKKLLVKLLPDDFVNSPSIIKDLVPEKSTVILVIPIDKEAPKGRIILPQVQTIRELLDNNCICISVKENELEDALNNLKTPPALVVTDSQAFKKVSQIVPDEIPLTSFSILFARLKGDLNAFLDGVKAIDNLKENDKVLILESCTHHPIEDDIGRVKIPNLLKQKTGKNLIINNISGHDFPDISEYKLIIHCGACMTNRKEVLSRILLANRANIAITNYGIAISYCLGILARATKIFTNQ